MSLTWQRARGASYCLLWYTSILLGFYVLYAPCLPLLFVNRRLYRKLTNLFFSLWETFNVSLQQLLFGVRLHLSGDPLRAHETSLIVLNHRTRVDWNFLWSALLHASAPSTAHNAKLVLKNEVKVIPGIGWTMQMARFLYISRHWKTDELKMGRMVDYLAAGNGAGNAGNAGNSAGNGAGNAGNSAGNGAGSEPFQLVLFPEGTNLTPQTKAKSDKFAADNGAKPYDFVLHPRTTGFSFLADRMRATGCLNAVYDVTIAYPDQVPEDERALAEGKMPKEIHFHVKRYGLQDIPNTLVGLERWLQEIWRDKERALESFYQEGVPLNSSPGVTLPKLPQKPLPFQYLSLIAWLYFLYWTLFHFVLTCAGVLWLAMVSLFMYLVSRHTDGLQELEIGLERRGLWAVLREAAWPVGARVAKKKE